MNSYLSTHISLSICLGLAGLGLFLMSVKLMSNSLKTMSGGYTVKLLKKFSTNRFLSFAFGAIFTTMIQSSDGAIALVIGLIAAGMMNLRAAIPFILGANIGTATTSLLVWLGGKVEFTQYFLLFTLIGAFGYMLIKEKKKSNIAMLIFSIGSLFFGLKVMGIGMSGVASTNSFRDVVSGVSINPWSAMFSSTLLTGLMQSSSATVTVVQSVYDASSADANIMPIASAIGMVIGANIGTTFTAFVTSIGAGKETKKIAFIWLFTNLLMALIVMPMIGWYSSMIASMTSVHMLQLSLAHLIFNGALAFIFIWLITPLEKLVNIVIKTKKSDFKYEIHLPAELLSTSPPLAFESAKNCAYELAHMSKDAIILLQEYFELKDKHKLQKFNKLTGLIETTRKGLYAYLIELGSRDISKRTANRHMSLVLASRSLERVPILGKEFLDELSTKVKRIKHENGETEKRVEFGLTSMDYQELKDIIEINVKLSKMASKQIKSNSKKRAEEMIELGHQMDEKIIEYSGNHVERSKKERASFDFLYGIKLLSRMGHHSMRVSNYINRGRKDSVLSKANKKLEKKLLRHQQKNK